MDRSGLPLRKEQKTVSDEPKKPTDTSAMASEAGALIKHLGREGPAGDIAMELMVNGADPVLASILGDVAALSQNGGIEAMEAKGQQELVGSDSLPSELQKPYDCEVDVQAEMSKLGFELGSPFEDDPIFLPAKLPEGWTKVSSDHDMWSYLEDEKGRRRAGIFYKAAFYDRSAHWGFDCRLSLRRDYDLGRETNGQKVRHTITAVIKGENAEHLLHEVIEEAPDSKEHHDAASRAAAATAGSKAKAWIEENYPDWNNPFAYWDLEF